MNNRRRRVVALGGWALAAPFGAFAQQQGKVWRIGFLGNRRPDSGSHASVAFLQTLRELGYVEGKNLVIEWRFADNKLDRFPGMAAELVQLKVDVILATVSAAVTAAQKASTTIPIVMGTVSDPVGLRVIRSLARPGGNVTRPATFTGELGPKRLEMLHTMVPKVSRMALLANGDNYLVNAKAVESIQAAAQKRRVTIVPIDARTPQQIESAFATMVREKTGALMVLLNPLFQQQRSQIAELALKHRLPVSAADPIYVEAGRLMSYGTSLADDYRRAAIYVDKIFKGAKPADLPVEQPTIFELVINGKTAKALGLTIPQNLLMMANKIIE